MSDNVLTKIHYLNYGQQICFDLPEVRCEPVRLTSKLVSVINPLYVNVHPNGVSDDCPKSSKKPRLKHDGDFLPKELVVDSLSKKNRTCIAFVDGVLNTRDG